MLLARSSTSYYRNEMLNIETDLGTKERTHATHNFRVKS